MTWWAAALGFIGALAGSWGGQLIASRREDRRWDREREREDIRAQRDREKEHRQRVYDMKVQWRAERQLAYKELLSVLASWHEVFLQQTVGQCQSDNITAARRALVEARFPLRDALATVDLVSSPEAAKEAHSTIARIHSIEDDWFRVYQGIKCENMMSHYDNWGRLIDQLRDVMRADLGVVESVESTLEILEADR
jgi:hypothetical protein